MRISILFFVAVLTSWPVSAMSQDAFKMHAIVLLNPMDQFESRAPSTITTSGFINQIKASAGVIVNKTYAEDKTARSGLIAVAIRPDGSIKYWLDVADKFKPKMTSDLQTAMSKVGTLKVYEGPVAFVVHFDIWGGVKNGLQKPKNAKGPGPLPMIWREAAENAQEDLLLPEDMLDLVWPAQQNANAENKPAPKYFAPEGYVLQSLDPVGGSILRPKDWHFNEAHGGNKLMWTISKEPPQEYITGFRIQMFAAVSKLTNKTPEELMKNFLASKSKSAKVLSNRPAVKIGTFTRVGLETEEPQVGKDAEPFRIIYTCSWDNDMDMAVLTVFGTTTDQWKEHEEIIEVMSNLTMMDATRMKPPFADADPDDKAP